MYDELVDNSFYHAPPYLPPYGFMQQTKRWLMLSLSVMEWEDTRTADGFIEYMKKYYPSKGSGEVISDIDRRIV